MRDISRKSDHMWDVILMKRSGFSVVRAVGSAAPEGILLKTPNKVRQKSQDFSCLWLGPQTGTKIWQNVCCLVFARESGFFIVL